MFDNINYEDECPTCGHLLTDYQSKDGPCSMVRLDFWEVENFYCHCSKCETWVEYILSKKRPNRKLIIKDYDKTIKTKVDEEDIVDDED